MGSYRAETGAGASVAMAFADAPGADAVVRNAHHRRTGVSRAVRMGISRLRVNAPRTTAGIPGGTPPEYPGRGPKGERERT
jgi:hypothetical protein